MHPTAITHANAHMKINYKDKPLYLMITFVFISEGGSMLTLDGSSFPDISPLLIATCDIPTTLLKNWLQ